MVKTNCIIILVLTLLVPACNKKAPNESNEISSLNFNRNYTFYVDRVADHPAVQFPMDTLAEEQYSPVNSGKSYEVKFSEDGEKVYIDNDSLTGSLNSKTESKMSYNIIRGFFVGGRFVIWPKAQSITAELTEYGSGVPIIFSERGRLVRK